MAVETIEEFKKFVSENLEHVPEDFVYPSLIFLEPEDKKKYLDALLNLFLKYNANIRDRGIIEKFYKN